MDSLATLTSFLGWCTAINMSALLLATIALVTFRDLVVKVHSRTMRMDSESLALLYAQYLSNYKIAIIMLNLVPYVALRIMG